MGTAHRPTRRPNDRIFRTNDTVAILARAVAAEYNISLYMDLLKLNGTGMELETPALMTSLT